MDFDSSYRPPSQLGIRRCTSTSQKRFGKRVGKLSESQHFIIIIIIIFAREKKMKGDQFANRIDIALDFSSFL